MQPSLPALLRRLTELGLPPTSYAPYGEEYAQEFAGQPSPIARPPQAQQAPPQARPVDPRVMNQRGDPRAQPQGQRIQLPSYVPPQANAGMAPYMQGLPQRSPPAPPSGGAIEPQGIPSMPDRQRITPNSATTVLPQERPEEQASPGRAGQGPAKLRALAGVKPPMAAPQLPSQSAVDAMAQAPVDPTQGAGFNPQINPEMGGGRPVSPSQPDQSYGQNWLQKLLGPNADTLLHAGLGMMSAASKPGATALGALGEGGMFALSEADKRKRLDIQDKREDRQIRQGDRRLDLEDKGLKIKEKDFLLQLEQRATDNKLNREARAAAQAEMLEFRKLQLESQQGNQAATRAMTAMIEGGRREDRDSQRQDRLDQGAGTHYERLLGRYKDEMGQVTPEARRQAEDVILRAYPTSTFAQQIQTERKAEKATGEPLPSLNGKPDPTKLTVGKTYSTARGPAKWNGTAFEAAQ